jgi:hypothetical protein
MPSFETKLFDQLEVTITLSEDLDGDNHGEIESVCTETGVELDFTGVLFKMDNHIPPLVSLDTYLLSQIEDCMNDWFYELKEHQKSRGRDRVGED